MKFIYEENKIDLMDDTTVVGEVTFYHSTEDTIIADHAYIDDNYRGNGFGANLVEKLVEYAREKKLYVIPQCSFVKKEFDEHPEYSDIIKSEN